ncbi:hypothetical protein [Streptomyces swartbergensis]|uniref:hypothetical protein n=1 Tax=Streptomyces swartbergensis TaxID=487165 RepID=UPI00142D6B7D|nr:hypothetical protein [Streptomyces swartbergensis]
MTADLQHLLDAGAGGAEKLHRRPGPERAMLGLTGMANSALLVPRASGRRILGTDEDRVADREGGTRWDGEQGLKAGRLLGVVIDRSPDEGLQDGQPLARSLVPAGLAPLDALAVGGFSLLDRAGCCPGSPPGGFLGRPTRDVQVESPHCHEQLVVFSALDERLFHGAVRPFPPLDPGSEPLLPRGGDPGLQVEGGDAWMMYLQVGPEVPGQVAGEVVEGAVVEPWLAFLQVVDQQLADRCSGHAVPVDQLRAGELTRDLV